MNNAVRILHSAFFLGFTNIFHQQDLTGLFFLSLSRRFVGPTLAHSPPNPSPPKFMQCSRADS